MDDVNTDMPLVMVCLFCDTPMFWFADVFPWFFWRADVGHGVVAACGGCFPTRRWNRLFSMVLMVSEGS